jgi:hypothetical protein
MGDWNATVVGTGVHHNNDPKTGESTIPEQDANRIFERFVAELREAGHTIHHASFVSGGKDQSIS